MNADTYTDADKPDARMLAIGRLVKTIQEISLARDLDSVIRSVRTAARELMGADGATFILRDNGKCHYVDEDAISPLWKGQRFPMEACVSGWAMLNRKVAIIPDIYDDPRVPVDAYRPTFVKSLVMVPIRVDAPIGAIGTYWARFYQASPYEVELLQTLANVTSVAMENVQVYQELEHRVSERTRELEEANRELESFSYSVSHDLRNPLTSIGLCASMAEGSMGPDGNPRVRAQLRIIREATSRMEALIRDLMQLAACRRTEFKVEEVDLSALTSELLERHRCGTPERRVSFLVQPGIRVQGSSGLLRVMLENLVSNAWKYTSRNEHTEIEFGLEQEDDGLVVVYLRDNGAGFDMAKARELFVPFKRLHSQSEFTGTGIGLATVRRIIDRHGGWIRAEGREGKGATFRFALPASPT